MSAPFPALQFLRCPVCGAAFSVQEKSLVCACGHCFDIARKGYVNLAGARRTEALYDRALFESRRRILQSGLYAPVVEALCEQIARYAPQRTLLVDAGCGEGFYARSLAPLFEAVVAFDLAREGVALAASGGERGHAAYLVADLTRIPVRDGAADVLLDVLTPACYAEFARVLRVGGILIKVLPREGYLCQLRALAAKGAYSNRDVLARMDDACAGGFAPLVRRAVTYTRPLPAGLRGDAVRMSPLSHREAAFDAAALQALTIDLEIAVLRRSA